MVNVVANDSHDLLRQFDSVSGTQRIFLAEYQRQQNRLNQLVRWYDHQQAARDTELRHQFDYVNKESRRQIYHRSKIVIKERARIKHLLDDDINHIFTIQHIKPHSLSRNYTDERKRQIYGCSLPQFKAPVTKSSDDWLEMRFHARFNQSEYKKRLERQRWLIQKYTQQSPLQQRHRINNIMDKCIEQLVECDGDGYDHFLQISEPNRNAQILAQQNFKQKNQNKIQ